MLQVIHEYNLEKNCDHRFHDTTGRCEWQSGKKWRTIHVYQCSKCLGIQEMENKEQA